MKGNAVRHSSPRSRTKEPKPHLGVYVRIGRSAISGVGVIAIREIPRGTDVFGADDEEMVWVPVKSVSRLTPSLRALYEDFCVQSGAKYGCPQSFNTMTVAWYLNHSNRPNVASDVSYRFVATRRIKEGEELTADYRLYSDDPLPWLRRQARRV